MVKYKTALLALAFILIICNSKGQGTFVNLGFEAANIVPIPNDTYNRANFGPALPGWTGYVNGIQETVALYNNFYLSLAGTGIIQAGSTFSSLVIAGNYSALIEAGLVLLNGNGSSVIAEASLAQTGMVPSDAQSLKFAAQYSLGDFNVTLGGNPLSLTALSTGPNYTVYGADISAWAGQTAELKFTSRAAPTPPGSVNILMLDGIQFSPTAVPEPEVLGLGAAAAICLCLSRKRMR